MKKQAEADFAEKKTELATLSCELEEKERDFKELSHSFEQFQRRYSSLVGHKQVELNRLNAELADVVASKARYGNKANPKSSGGGNPFARSVAAGKDVTVRARQESYSIKELQEAKKLYRKIAAVIHPDKAKEGGTRHFRTALMAELNDAYARNDTSQMQRILDEWHESPESVVGEGPDAELLRIHRAIGRVKKRLLEIETEISRIRSSDMYNLMVTVSNAEKAGKDILAEMSASLNAKIKDAQNRLVLKMYG